MTDDIFSLNGCYLTTNKDSLYIGCSDEQLKIADKLLENDTSSDLSIAASTLVKNGLIANESDANIVKSALSNLELRNKNVTRSIQINTYYAKKQTAQNYILKVVYIMVILVVLLWAIQTYTTIFPEWVISAAMIITIAVSSIIIIFKSADISNRSTFDYDQQISSIKNLPPIDEQDALYKSADQLQNSASRFGMHCQDSACCPKFYSFNPSLGYCSFNPFT